MVWHLIKPTLPLLSKPFRTASMDFLGYSTSQPSTSNQQQQQEIGESWKNCVTKTDSMLGFGTGYFFVEELKKQKKYNEKEVKPSLSLVLIFRYI